VAPDPPRQRLTAGRTGLAGLAALAAIGSPGPRVAAAEDGVEPIRLEYRASGDCPSEAEFIARVRARTSRIRPAWSEEPARTFSVALDAGPPPAGRLQIAVHDKLGGKRSVQADRCSDVADALALMVALAVDPQADARPSVASSAAAEPARAEPAPVTTDAPAHRAAPRYEAARFSAGLDFVLATAVAPSAVLGGSAYVGFRTRSEGWFDPSLRLAFAIAGGPAIDVPAGGRASFLWTTGRADACAITWPHAPLRLTACARLEAGALRVAGSAIVGGKSATRPWVAAGPLLRAEWPVTGPLFMDADASLLFRAVEDRFYFLPDRTVYQVPLAGLGVGIGLGWRFL
jgi:hypothetical protein